MATSSNTKQLKVDILVKSIDDNYELYRTETIDKLLSAITKADVLEYAKNSGVNVSIVSTKVDMLGFVAMGIEARDKARQ